MAPFADLGDFYQGLVVGLLQGEEVRSPGFRGEKREEGRVFMRLGVGDLDQVEKGFGASMGSIPPQFSILRRSSLVLSLGLHS